MVEKFFNQKTNTNSQFQINKIHSETNHDWGKWEGIECKVGDDWPYGIYMLQVRLCKGCGFKQGSLQKLLI